MSKFNVGDRVRLTRDNMGFGKTGDAGEIVNPDAGHEDAIVRFDREINGGHKWFAPWSSLELVPVAEATGTARPKFKVGDRVRIASGPNNGGFGQIGDTGVIEIVGKTDCLVRYGDGSRSGEAWYVGFGYLEHAKPATITIQAGKFYRTRDGRKVGPATPSGDTDYPWWVGESTYTDSGAWVDGMEDDNDLVAEADEPPAEPQSTKEILDELEAWIAEQDAIEAAGKGSTTGFTVPLFDEDDFDICGHRDSDDDIVQLSVCELTAVLADSLKVARKVGKTIKRGDLVVLARPALVTGIDRYHASVQTDGGNYSLPLAALTTA